MTSGGVDDPRRLVCGGTGFPAEGRRSRVRGRVSMPVRSGPELMAVRNALRRMAGKVCGILNWTIRSVFFRRAV